MALEIKKTWDEDRMRRDRLERLQSEMQRQDVGALYITGINSRYVLNAKVPSVATFIPSEGDLTAFIRPRDSYANKSAAKLAEPLWAGDDSWELEGSERTKKIGLSLKQMMKENGVEGESIAVDQVDSAVILSMIEAGLHVVPARPVVELARSVKTADEVEIYRTIGRQYEHTFNTFRAAVKPGISEKELADLTSAAWLDADGEEVSQINVCAGEDMNPWRRWATDRQLRADEFVGLDFHGRSNTGMRGDSTRTFFVGDKPTTEQRDLYRRAYDYLQKLISEIRGGRPIADVYASAPKVPASFEEQLFDLHYFHCIGMTPAGYPNADPRKAPIDDVLKENQVFAVECYMGERGSPLAVKLEEMILVTKGEPERLAPKLPYDERLLN
jgi:Xaa-Pro aminopeptidase